MTAPADFLAGMAGTSRRRAEALLARESLSTLRARAEAAPAAPPLRLSPAGFDLIAEVKRRSPALGRLADDGLSPAEQAADYVAGDAAALSVLTEPDRFDGSLEDLAAVAVSAAPVPAMRKDFLVDPCQVLEARVAGAGGVLLIGAILDPAQLRDMVLLTRELGMFALVEAFDEAELERCVAVMHECGPAIANDVCHLLIGVNCRDLRTLQVDFDRFGTLAGALPDDIPAVAESGVDSTAQVEEIVGCGYRLALVGTALMRSEDPSQTAREFVEVGRRVAS